MNEPIQEKAPKPPGLLPKHVQSWLILGLAVLMVVIMWLTGGKKAQTVSKPNAPAAQAPAPLQVNEAQIAEMQSRIQELQRQELIAQNALADQGRVLGVRPTGQQANQAGYDSNSASTERGEDPIEAERKKRAYVSLFASNIALSYRKNAAASAASASKPAPQNPDLVNPLPPSSDLDAAQLAQLFKDMQPPVGLQPPATVQPTAVPSVQARSASANPTETGHNKKKVTGPAAAASSGTASVAAGQTYILFEGTILETVLVNRLDGSFSGPVECLLTNDVYSHDRQHLLIPAGTKILGEAKKVEALGQTRLAVVFHRLIMPDGYSVSLDQFKGLDQIGDTGLRDKTNNHYLRIFGASLAIGALGAVSEAGTGGALTASGSDVMRQGFAQSTAQSSEQILDRFLNILPTVTIREGHRIKVYLSGDLALPDYNNHKTPSDF
ncbi:MAG TPA: TrbI/VirB10 family protein [Candidatus Acidoferrales bacterium]|nr:TrbI/VirB10 family protein [Candidatus Acidoferrales bacterium]